MFVRVKTHPSWRSKQIQLCRSFRENGKMRQKVVRHIGTARTEDEIVKLKALALIIKSQIEAAEEQTFSEPIIEERDMPEITSFGNVVEQSRYVEGFHEVFEKLFYEIGFHEILSKDKSDLLLDVILARIAVPCSKLKTQRILNCEFGRDASVDRIYRMMDAFAEKKEDFQRKIFSKTSELSNGEIDLLLFDVTTLYFESTETDELREFGFSKDQKFHTTQVVLALATTKEGLPVGYRLFPGNTAEVSTLIASLQEWRRILPIGKVIFVGDRAMMSEANMLLLEEAQIGYVIAAKLKRMNNAIQTQILQGPKQKEEGEKAYQEFMLPNGRRLIVNHSLKREEKDRSDRNRGIERVRKKLGKGKSLKRLIPNYGYQKYVRIDGGGTVLLDDEKIENEKAWDGFHGVITNCLGVDTDALLSHYRRLWVIEESFRIQKHNLKIRPIYHFKPERIEAHILLCYLSFSLLRYLEHRLVEREEKISIEEVKEALWSVQASMLYDKGNGEWYRMPSHFSENAQIIYHAVGVKRVVKARHIVVT